jgi:2,3-bisphosphoglycerate-dependent phosphoglycerate mutase
MHKLVLIRHGESTWNLENRFTGWTDVDLTPTGIEQAKAAGRLLRAEGWDFDVCHTSVLKRAIHTLWHCLDEMDRSWLPVVQVVAAERAPLRRPAGPEQGRNGEEVRRRAGAGLAPQLRHPPPPLEPSTRAASAPTALRPAQPRRGAADRVPEGHGGAGAAVLERGHGAGHPVRQAAAGVGPRQFDPRAGEVPGWRVRRDIVGLNIPNGIPLVYELDADLKPIRHYYLGDAEAAAKAAAAVATKAKPDAPDPGPAEDNPGRAGFANGL